MSTKAIREALSDARASAVEWGMQNTVAGIDAAMAEVEAIERAARDWYAVVIGVEASPASDAFAPFERIAISDAPTHEETASRRTHHFVADGILPRCASPGCPHHVMNTGDQDMRPTSRWCYEHTMESP